MLIDFSSNNCGYIVASAALGRCIRCCLGFAPAALDACRRAGVVGLVCGRLPGGCRAQPASLSGQAR